MKKQNKVAEYKRNWVEKYRATAKQAEVILRRTQDGYKYGTLEGQGETEIVV